MASGHSVELQLREGMRFRARTGTGHDVELDSPAGAGAPTAGVRPVEMVLVALGGCAAMDVISILRKMREDVTGYAVRVEGARRDEHPRVYTAISVVHHVRGRAMKEANVARAIQLSMTRYCPVFAMLSPTVPISERYEIIDEETGAVVAGEVVAEPAAGDAAS